MSGRVLKCPRYTEQYSPEMMATLLLPAGITSPASINYKDEDTIISQMTEKGLSVDQAYVEHVLPEKMRYNLAYLRSLVSLETSKSCFKPCLKC